MDVFFIKFQKFQGPFLFSMTFYILENEYFFKDFQERVATLYSVPTTIFHCTVTLPWSRPLAALLHLQAWVHVIEDCTRAVRHQNATQASPPIENSHNQQITGQAVTSKTARQTHSATHLATLNLPLPSSPWKPQAQALSPSKRPVGWTWCSVIYTVASLEYTR